MGAAWDLLLERLATTQPEHRTQFVRIGAGLADHTDPRLLAQMPATLRPSAVLIGLLEGDDGPGVLLTVRADHLRHHAGQIAFPGGVVEAGDGGPAAAALREAQEEVGLPPQTARVVGYLPDQVVLTGFRITPVVARIDAGFEPRLDASEVQSCFVLPLSALLDVTNERPGTRRIAGIDVAVRDLQYREHRIWGDRKSVV